MIVIGLEKGAISAQDFASKQNTYEAVKKIFKQFEEKNGSTVCRELLNCDISIPEQYQQAKEKELFKTVCSGLVKNAVEILEEILKKTI